MLFIAIVILYYDYRGRAFEITFAGWIGFILSAIMIIVSFCIAGAQIAKENYRDYFYWPLFAAGLIPAVGVFVKSLLVSGKKT